jgi:hypothetical protein
MPRAQFEALEARCQVQRDQGVDSDKSTVEDNGDDDNAEESEDPQEDPALVETKFARTQSTCSRESFSSTKEQWKPSMTTR